MDLAAPPKVSSITRKAQRQLLARIDDLAGTVDLLWHTFIAPLWGRVRDLEQLLERAGVKLALQDPPNVDDLLRRHTLKVLAQTRGRKKKAAMALGISESCLYKWTRRWEEQARKRAGA